jgi:hypothetical protein
MLYSSVRLNTFRIIKFRLRSSKPERHDDIEMFMQPGNGTTVLLNLAFFWGKFD